MTALVYSHICLKTLYKFVWNSARDSTELLNDRLRAFLHNLNFLGPLIQVETSVFNVINSLSQCLLDRPDFMIESKLFSFTQFISA